jgi:hypothetical protein
MADLTGLSDAELQRRLSRLHAARERRANMPSITERNGHPGTNGRAPAEPAKPTSPVPPAVPTAVYGDGRDAATGRFLPGNRAARGNPCHRRLAELRKAFAESAAPEKVK